MTNHIHLVLKPSSKDGLQKVLKPLHMRYAQHNNKLKRWKGHLWQGRFFSSALDGVYTWSTIRNVERYPVRAKMLTKAEDYPWSNAAFHCGLEENRLLTGLLDTKRAISEHEWSKWSSLPEEEDHIKILRRNVEKELPCGSDSFIEGLEKLTDRQLRFRPQGRPIKG